MAEYRSDIVARRAYSIEKVSHLVGYVGDGWVSSRVVGDRWTSTSLGEPLVVAAPRQIRSDDAMHTLHVYPIAIRWLLICSSVFN